MGAPKQPGVLLSRQLDERSPSRRFDAQLLAREIEELERAVHPVKLLTAFRRKGPLVEVVVIAASEVRRERGVPRLVPTEPRPKSAPTQVTAWRSEGW